MNNKNKNLIKDLKQIISTYLTKANAEDLFKLLDEKTSLQSAEENSFGDLDKTHLEYEVPKGYTYRIILDKIITICAKVLSEEKYNKLMLDIAELMFFSGELTYSLEITEDLLSKLQSDEKQAKLLAEDYLLISKIYWAQANWEDCNYYVSEATKIFRSINCEGGLAKCENMLGTVYGEKGEFDQAQNHFNNALVYLGKEGDLALRAMIFTNLGIICTINNDYEKAIWNYKTAEEIFNEVKDSRRLARVYHNIGMLYTRMENFDSALDEFNKCITFSLEKDYLSNCAVAYLGKAFIYNKLSNQPLADAYADKAMELAYKLNDTLSIADIYKIKGMIQNDMNNFELSEELFENSIRLNKDIENKLNEAESAVQLGELLQRSNRIEEAKPYLSVAANFFNKLNHENITAGLVEHSI